jgi:hypothetical protein
MRLDAVSVDISSDPRPRLAPALILAVVVLTSLVPITSRWAAAASPERAPSGAGAFRVAEGLEIKLFAEYPQLANPVAIGLDERGRVYAAEEYRFNRGTEENRTRPFLLEDDLQIQTLDDRLAMFRKWADRFEGGMGWFTRHSEKVRLVEDSDGDGRADRSTIFAEGFNGPLDGLAAGGSPATATSTSPASRTSGCSATTTATAGPTPGASSTAGSASMPGSSATTSTA